MSDKIIHLHWLWHMGPKAVHQVTKGMSLCGEKDLPPGDFVVALEDATCERCKEIATTIKTEPPPPLAAEPPRRFQKGVKIAWTPDGSAIIKMIVKHNVKKIGSAAAERFRILLDHDGKTVQEFLSAGGNVETLRNAIKDENAEIE
jgi:hypothetical protein